MNGDTCGLVGASQTHMHYLRTAADEHPQFGSLLNILGLQGKQLPRSLSSD